MKVGDIDKCVDCLSVGVVVATNLEGTDFDRELARRAGTALEPSAYIVGLTCRPCETQRLRSALPERGSCPACGRENRKAIAGDLGATRSFCNDACINAFLNRSA